MSEKHAYGNKCLSYTYSATFLSHGDRIMILRFIYHLAKSGFFLFSCSVLFFQSTDGIVKRVDEIEGNVIIYLDGVRTHHCIVYWDFERVEHNRMIHFA